MSPSTNILPVDFGLGFQELIEYGARVSKWILGLPRQG